MSSHNKKITVIHYILTNTLILSFSHSLILSFSHSLILSFSVFFIIFCGIFIQHRCIRPPLIFGQFSRNKPDIQYTQHFCNAGIQNNNGHLRIPPRRICCNNHLRSSQRTHCTRLPGRNETYCDCDNQFLFAETHVRLHSCFINNFLI